MRMKGKGLLIMATILFSASAFASPQDGAIPPEKLEEVPEGLYMTDEEFLRSLDLSDPSASIEVALEADDLRAAKKEESNLYIVPLHEDKLQAKIVKGQEDPVQGWSSDPWREIPTVVYSQRAKGRTRFIYLFYPVPKRDPAEGDLVIPQLREADSDRGSCVEVVFS